jgi:hypothetical protein
MGVPTDFFMALPDKLAIVYSSLTGIDVDDATSLITCGGLIGPLETEVSVERMPADAVTESLRRARDDRQRRRCGYRR